MSVFIPISGGVVVVNLTEIERVTQNQITFWRVNWLSLKFIHVSSVNQAGERDLNLLGQGLKVDVCIELQIFDVTTLSSMKLGKSSICYFKIPRTRSLSNTLIEELYRLAGKTTTTPTAYQLIFMRGYKYVIAIK